MKTSKILSLIFVAVLLSFGEVSFADETKKDGTDNIGNYRVEGIDVVQGRVFRKGMRHEFGIDGGLAANNTFLFYETARLNYTFHFNEGLAIEASYGRWFNQEKGIINDLRNNIPCPSPTSDINGDGTPDTNCGVELASPPDPHKNAYFASLIWSPIYGKFSIFSKKIYHFDVYITAGAGYFDNKFKNHFSFSVGGGAKVFLNDFMTASLDFRNYTVRESAPFSQIANDRLLSLGVSFFLPPHSYKE